MFFAVPNDPELPQLGPFDDRAAERWMRPTANASFGENNWVSNTEQDTTRSCISPWSTEWEALVLGRIIAERDKYLTKYGASSWKIEMIKAYRNSTGCSLVEARNAIVAALAEASPSPD